MVQDKGLEKDARKSWDAPTVRRLAAGAAEAGNNVNEDGGGTFSPRS